MAELSERRIYQWSTFYRETIRSVFDEFTEHVRHTAAPTDLADVLRAAFTEHALAIFHKGAKFQLDNASDAETTIFKSLNGLERFLDLPVASYLSALSQVADTTDARGCRLVCSAMLTGILLGYGGTDFNGTSGWAILTRDASTKRWAYSMAFLTRYDLRRVADALGVGPLSAGIIGGLQPFAETIDRMVEQPAQILLPLMGEYRSDQAPRLDILLSAPTRPTRGPGSLCTASSIQRPSTGTYWRYPPTKGRG